MREPTGAPRGPGGKHVDRVQLRGLREVVPLGVHRDVGRGVPAGERERGRGVVLHGGVPGQAPGPEERARGAPGRNREVSPLRGPPSL